MLAQLFQVLDTLDAERQATLDLDLRSFQYVNGALFRDRFDMPSFDGGMRKLLIEACAMDWGKVSPAIFGSLFQSVMDKDKRRNLGAHYTSEKNILKVVHGLFLDDLLGEFEAVKNNLTKLRASGDRYRPVAAMGKAYERRAQKGRRRIPQQVWTEIEAEIREEWSPEQITGRRRSSGGTAVSHERIYQHIYEDMSAGGDLHTYLRCRKKRRKRYGSYAKRGFRHKQVSIDERPQIVADKGRIGDLDVDTIIGKGHNQAIVTIVDRKSKLLRMKKVTRKTSTLVRQAICRS